MIRFTINGLPKRTNNLRANWRAVYGERKKWKALVLKALVGQIPDEPMMKADVTLIRHSSVEPDADGLVSGFKPILDGLVEARVLFDDKPKVIGFPNYKWCKASPKKGYIEVIIKQIE